MVLLKPCHKVPTYRNPSLSAPNYPTCRLIVQNLRKRLSHRDPFRPTVTRLKKQIVATSHFFSFLSFSLLAFFLQRTPRAAILSNVKMAEMPGFLALLSFTEFVRFVVWMTLESVILDRKIDSVKQHLAAPSFHTIQLWTIVTLSSTSK